MVLKTQIFMLIVAALAFFIGFILGSAWAERKNKKLVKRVRVLEKRQETMKILCPKIKWAEDDPEKKGGYLPESFSVEKVKSETVKGKQTGIKFTILKHGSPRTF